jgi:3-deoxy-D-manno-octulosonic-acid transferase
MNSWQTAYNFFALPPARAALRIAAPWKPKLRAGLDGRKASFARMESFLAAHCDGQARGGILLHASSVGEYLQAAPLMQRIRQAGSSLPLYLSYFSPSVEKRALSCNHANLSFFLPEDTRGNMKRLLNTLAPRLIVVSKFDIWPNLVWEAAYRGIPVVVTAATLSPDSGRLRGVAGSFHRSFYSLLSQVCAISREDADNFIQLGVAPQCCVVTGDTRFDQTWERALAVEQNDSLLKPFQGWNDGVKLAAGSIWPADQQKLLPALGKLCGRFANLRLILAPHEPSAEHVRQLTGFCDQSGLKWESYSSFNASASNDQTRRQVEPDTRVVIVDTVGALAAVYRAADLAYIGGSFSSGVHNTMEPACFALPLLFGPRYLNSYEARLMLEAGGAFTADTAELIEQQAGRLIDDEDFRQLCGQSACRVVKSNLGATDRTVRALSDFFPELIPQAVSLPDQETGND